MAETKAANPAVQPLFATQARWRPQEIAFWLLPIVAYVLFPDYLALARDVAIAALFALSLDLILGYAGLVSLGHAAFYGLGAYSAGLLAKAGWGEPFSGLLLAGAVAGILGLATSFLIVRVQHLALIMITMGVGFLLHEAANRAAFITGGDDGLQGVAIWPLFGKFTFDLYGRVAFIYALVVLFLVFLVARRLIHSPFGLSLRGIRENLVRMPAIGAPVQRRLQTAYTIAAVMAGIAGGLQAQTTQFVSLEVLSFERSADVLIMLVLGGTGRLYGGLIGAAVFIVARDQLSDMNPFYWYFWMGLLLVLVVLFARGGIIGGAERIWTLLRHRIGGRT